MKKTRAAAAPKVPPTGGRLGRRGDRRRALTAIPSPCSASRRSAGELVARAFIPHAETVDGLHAAPASRSASSRAATTPASSRARCRSASASRSRYRARNAGGEWCGRPTPIRFGPVLGPMDDYYIARRHASPAVRQARRAPDLRMKAPTACISRSGRPTPGASRVVGDFNGWDGRRHPMRLRRDTGIWEIFIPDLGEGQPYKYEIVGAGRRAAAAQGRSLRLPLGAAARRPPRSSPSPVRHDWGDAAHREFWSKADHRREPMSIYEVHARLLAAARRRHVPVLGRAGRPADPLCRRHGLHPYRVHADHRASLRSVLGLPDRPASTRRPPASAIPHGFARFVDGAHRAGIGIILDWVPAHFPTDEHGLAHFDGTALYEHADPRQGFHPDWNTAIYNFGRRRCCPSSSTTRSTGPSGSISTGCASMRSPRCSTSTIRARPASGSPTSTAAARTSRPSTSCSAMNRDGLRHASRRRHHRRGIDRLARGLAAGPRRAASASASSGTWASCTTRCEYMAREPIHRKHHHNEITFGLLYAFTENFVLPLSAMTRSCTAKARCSTRWRATTGRSSPTCAPTTRFMWGYPGKKLLFMGQEFAQRSEWSEARGARLAPARSRAASRRAAAGARPQLRSTARGRRCMRATARPTASPG